MVPSDIVHRKFQFFLKNQDKEFITEMFADIQLRKKWDKFPQNM